MNKVAQTLIQKINTETENTPIIYFSRDSERAIGLENHLKNYYIVCIEKGYITDQFEKLYPGRIFCTEEKGIKLDKNSTLELVNNEKVIEWLKTITKGEKFYAQLFQFTQPVYLQLQKLGAIILNNTADLNRLFEDKLSQYRILSEKHIPIPKSEVLDVSNLEFKTLLEKFGNKFVFQLDRAHTGSGTFIIESQSDFNNFKNSYDGNIVKISEFIEGEPYTINACITDNQVFVNGLQYQITGYSELTPGKGSTVGNDWSYANNLSEDIKSNIREITEDIGEIMKAKGYRGLFGVDLIIRNNQVLIIEINARQTANTSLQTKLELNQNQVPLMLIHLAEFLKIPLDQQIENKISHIEGSQIFLRAKEEGFNIGNHLFSGIYRLQSGNSALNWSFDKIRMIITGMKKKVIFLDEEKDKPLIWQNDGYSVDQIKDGGFILILQSKDSLKNKFEELARMQFTNQIVYNNHVSPWVIEALVNIEKELK